MSKVKKILSNMRTLNSNLGEVRKGATIVYYNNKLLIKHKGKYYFCRNVEPDQLEGCRQGFNAYVHSATYLLALMGEVTYKEHEQFMDWYNKAVCEAELYSKLASAKALLEDNGFKVSKEDK